MIAASTASYGLDGAGRTFIIIALRRNYRDTAGVISISHPATGRRRCSGLSYFRHFNYVLLLTAFIIMTTYSAPASQAILVALRRTHELPIWPDSFAAVANGTKPFDVRLNEQNFQVGDALLLRELNPTTHEYTGQTLLRWVSHVVPGNTFGVEAGWCVLGLGTSAPLPPGIMDTKLW